MTTRRRTRRLPLFLAVALVLGLVAPAMAGEEEPPDPLEPIPSDQVGANFDIDDGEYTGSMGMNGFFWFGAEGITVLWAGEGIGPMEFTVTDGDLEGTWSMTGAATISGAGIIVITGSNEWSVSGTVSGSNPYMLAGSGQGTSTATASGFTSTSDYPITVSSVPLDGVVQICGQVLANWDQAIDEGYEGLPPGFGYAIPTYVAVMPVNSLGELGERLEDLIEQGTEIQQDLSRDPIIIAGELGGLLTDAEQLLSDIEAYPDGCPPDPGFARLITQMVADVMNTFFNRFAEEEPDYLQAIELQRFVEVGLRAGAIGAGAGDTAIAEVLQAKAEALLQRQLDAQAEGEFDEATVMEIAITATMLGYEFDGGLTGQDLCLMLSGSSC